ncbi:hypothetical protein [Streptomyces sp. NPDC002209]|uniref:hypothetical protein n=1 Tax=Streptomyces sp. NPDC002209 TaxID=3364638 RepID=UPI0036870E9A
MTTLTNAAQAFPLSTASGFTHLYGIPVVAIEEDCGTLLMLGHPGARSILAATSAQYRRVYGQRILPGSELEDLVPFGVTKTWARAVPGGDSCPWHTELTSPEAMHALPVTLVSVDWLETEDMAVQEECPACGRASRTSDTAISPGRAGYSRVRTCRHCQTRWPSADDYRVSLYKVRAGITDPGACFGCGCTTAWTCSPGCQMTDPGPPPSRCAQPAELNTEPPPGRPSQTPDTPPASQTNSATGGSTPRPCAASTPPPRPPPGPSAARCPAGAPLPHTRPRAPARADCRADQEQPMTMTPLPVDGPDPWGTYAMPPVLETPGYPTTGGARTEVVGPDSWGAYRIPCTGCGTDENTSDVPPAVAETVAHSSARYHAKHCGPSSGS